MLLVALVIGACGGAAGSGSSQDDSANAAPGETLSPLDRSPEDGTNDEPTTTHGGDPVSGYGDDGGGSESDGSASPEPGSTDPNVAFAIADLAERIAVAESEIVVVSREGVTWRDGSLGCPQPGMSYTQALVDGYKITLEAGGTTYAYHGRAGRDPFLCVPNLIGDKTATFAPLEPNEDSSDGDSSDRGSVDN